MIDAVQTLAQSLVSTGTTSVAAGSDVERFRSALMSAPAGTPENLSSVVQATQAQVQVPQSPDTTVALNSKTLGDAILNTLNTASTQMNQTWHQAAQAVANKELNMADMLQLQMSVIQTSIQYELLSKGISKSTQNLDQILKTQ